ncbi:helix-turn-helix domain-containing protein [Microbacterium paraoxydans]|uniref:Helix-turn-helix domain-containing protein n=1 Tax=Microbacterium paraoxydans TaxID=199592 RepID=A0ABS5IK64_9MICO|nr:helix-turn-helix domain-containing protein [Microbacterium paraoxydans]
METQPFHSARQLGAVMRAARLRRGWSQTELAERAAVDRPWLVKLETGHLDNPTLRRVLQVVESLGLQLSVQEPVRGNSAFDLSTLWGEEDDQR